MTELEVKVQLLRLRINKLKHELKEIMAEKTEKEKAIFVYDDDPHFKKKL
tara:strand:- start:734 stop:883 length:150 start_codon:yes stop_codon:yes gene_type:complete